MEKFQGAEETSRPVPKKRAYAAPSLVVYGDLRVLTENKKGTGGDGAADTRNSKST